MNKQFVGVNGGKFTTQVEIGRGGFGVVYLAQDVKGKFFALKVLSEVDDDQKKLSFQQEIESVKNLICDNLLQIVDYGVLKLKDSEILFAVSPYCEGGSYRRVLTNRLTVDIENVISDMRQILLGLSVLHSRVIHRDLKPENILCDNNVLKIGDYGLSKFVDQATRTLTFKGAGTPIYMAPEVWNNKTISKATDLYAFGALFFETLTGKPPFDSKDIQELHNHHLYTPAPRVKSINSNVPDSIDGIIKKLLAKDPKDRYQDAKEVLDLLNVQNQQPSRDIKHITDKMRKYHDTQEAINSAREKKVKKGVKDIRRISTKRAN